MGGASPLGAFYERMTGSPLAFSFEGLLVGSLIFNLPFALIPMERAFESIPVEVRQAAECCGLSGTGRCGGSSCRSRGRASSRRW